MPRLKRMNVENFTRYARFFFAQAITPNLLRAQRDTYICGFALFFCFVVPCVYRLAVETQGKKVCAGFLKSWWLGVEVSIDLCRLSCVIWKPRRVCVHILYRCCMCRKTCGALVCGAREDMGRGKNRNIFVFGLCYVLFRASIVFRDRRF